MAFGTVVHHFAVGVGGTVGISGTAGGTVAHIIGISAINIRILDFGPHFLVIGFDGPRAGHLAQPSMEALIAARGHVIQWVVLC